jgi:uracil-xanthine permease
MGEIVNQTTIKRNEIVYKVDDRPPLPLSIVLALQHILAAFGGIVAVPLIVGQAIGVKIDDLSYLVSAAIFMAGLATFIQARGIGKCGARVSCMMGTDFSFVSAGILVGQSMGLAGYFGATILGSFVEIILSRFIKPLMKYFPPVVTGTVVTLIGLTLLPVSIDWAAGGYGAPDYGSLQNISIAMVVLLIALFLNKYGKGIVSSASVLIAIFFGYIICSFLGILDFKPVLDAKWIELPRIFKYGVKFSLVGVLPFIAPYLVTTIETVGCLIAIGEASEKPLSSEEVSAGILADGVGSFIAGFFGAGPNTSFSQNVGLIPLTKVASRYVMIVA